MEDKEKNIDFKKIILNLIELNNQIRLKERNISKVFECEFYIDGNGKLETAILDLMGFNEDGCSRDYFSSAIMFNECDELRNEENKVVIWKTKFKTSEELYNFLLKNKPIIK